MEQREVAAGANNVEGMHTDDSDADEPEVEDAE